MISRPNSTTTLINQTSDRAAIHRQSFNFPAGNAVQFQQPGSSAVALNRIHGSSPSAVAGNLTANGQVWFIMLGGLLGRVDNAAPLRSSGVPGLGRGTFSGSGKAMP